MQLGEILTVSSRAEFRNWLAYHHRTKKEIWLVIYKKASGRATITYEDAVEEALCFGWIDGIVKSLDHEKYVQRFLPRRKWSHWTEANRAKARRLIAEGKMSPAGRAVLPTELEA
ncbi:MAG: hypothetical protein ABSB41_18130 [Anaerolineales bacterium]|jgi:uncharacterized protein YdeI (YjbR/CyaY-like superfamily)